jgi:uncharacterized protein with PIN domain
MSKKIMRLPAKPFFDFTEAEKQQLFDFMETCIKNGTKLILGQTRCFFCGTELDKVVESKQIGKGSPSVMLSLCDNCWKRPEAQAFLKKSS